MQCYNIQESQYEQKLLYLRYFSFHTCYRGYADSSEFSVNDWELCICKFDLGRFGWGKLSYTLSSFNRFHVFLFENFKILWNSTLFNDNLWSSRGKTTKAHVHHISIHLHICINRLNTYIPGQIWTYLFCFTSFCISRCLTITYIFYVV